MRSQKLLLISQEKGAATLFLVSMLAMITAVSALSTTTVNMMEQRTIGNEFRAREAQEAAEAGLESALGWAQDETNTIDWAGNLVTAFPENLPAVTGSTSAETYNTTVQFMRNNLDSEYVKILATSHGEANNSLTATAERYVVPLQTEKLFGSGDDMPPPLVTAGCFTTAATGNPDIYLMEPDNTSVLTGSVSDSTCIPQGHFTPKTWTDVDDGDGDGNGYKDASDIVGAGSFNRDSFSGCPSLNCAWNEVFEMSLQDAKDLAVSSGNVYTDVSCGPATSPPSIYIFNNSGPLNPADVGGSCSDDGVDDKTIGGPFEPILLIVPSEYGCPKFNGGITIYGIIYYETTTDCAANGWGGATVYGSVIWEGNVDKPNANTEFVEVDYGVSGGDKLNGVFNMPKKYVSLPGTWKDF